MPVTEVADSSQVELVLVMIEAGEMRDSWVQMTLSGSSPMHPRS